MKPRRAITLSALAVLLFAGEAARPWPRATLGPVAAIVATRIALDPADPARRDVGRLRFIEGWTLSSPDPAFGGFSAMLVDGRRFVLVGDGGGVVRMTLGPGGAVGDAAFGDLVEGPGDGRGKESRDAEAVTRDPASGDVLVAFERSNAIARYDAGLRTMRAVAFPPEMARWADNAGAEAMAAMPDGTTIVIAEGGRRADGSRRALRFAGDPARGGARAVAFGLVPPDGFRVTDAASLPDGRLIALHRRIAPTRARFALHGSRPILTAGLESAVAIYDVREAVDGARIVAQPVAILAHPLNVDNFEAIAVVRDGRSLALWIASDDNRRRFQRTILMKFVLMPPTGAAAPVRPPRSS